MEQDFRSWRDHLPDDARRMSWWREVKWLLAAKLISVALSLVQKEIGVEGLRAFSALGRALKNDPRFDTVPMQPKRKD